MPRKKNESNTKKLLKEYNTKAELYQKFIESIHFLVEDMLKKGGYKYYIYSRLKSPDSLKEKIERKKQKGKTYQGLKEVKDVAGLRVIFYTESDRQKFISKIRKEFKGSIKIKKTQKKAGYRAIHATVSFGKERLKLSEYATFKGLECEIQLCLILVHAWAEIEHDILYKENLELKATDRAHYFFIKESMGRIMKNHINKASAELERIVLRYKKIKQNGNGDKKN